MCHPVNVKCCSKIAATYIPSHSGIGDAPDCCGELHLAGHDEVDGRVPLDDRLGARAVTGQADGAGHAPPLVLRPEKAEGLFIFSCHTLEVVLVCPTGLHVVAGN